MDEEIVSYFELAISPSIGKLVSQDKVGGLTNDTGRSFINKFEQNTLLNKKSTLDKFLHAYFQFEILREKRG